MARVLVVGAGVVGTAVGRGLAGCGHDVRFVDSSPERVTALQADGIDAADTIDLEGAAAIVFLTVPTPARDGQHDLTALGLASRSFGAALRNADAVHTLVVRSTVPPGTCDNVVQPLVEAVSGRRAGEEFLVASCPEFLRDATALDDFLSPRVTVIGSRHPGAIDALVALFGPLGGEVLTVGDPTTAELVKCVQNASNATKISFWNEVWRLARAIDVDAEVVAGAVALAAEGSYNPSYGTHGGAPFAGSCLEKDTEGLVAFADSVDVAMPVLEAVLAVNAAMRALERPAST